LKEVYHELVETAVAPRVITMFVNGFLIFVGEEFFEAEVEVIEQVVGEQATLYVHGKLPEHLKLLFRRYCLIVVEFPPIGEVSVHLLYELRVQLFALIEMLE
tara:strand:+ start:308 stop:613 length:306 start_codon:yes stop_codon:yes gene_type:complete